MCNRLQTMLPRLEAKLVEVEAQEYLARWKADRDHVEKLRDAAAQRFTKYPELVAKLVDLFREAEQVDKDVSRVNAAAPAGPHRHLKGVELTARGLESFSTSDRPITKLAVLPDYDHSAQTAWPIREVVDWASIAPVQYHPGADWAAARSDADAVQKQPDAVRREQQRIESYYRDQRRLQEERQRREAEEALAARQRSA